MIVKGKVLLPTAWILCVSMAGCVDMIGEPIIEPVRSVEDHSLPEHRLPQSEKFPGIASLLADSSRDVPVNVIWIHGMCSHFDDWARDRASIIEQLISGRAVKPRDVLLSKVAIPDTSFYLLRYELNVRGRTADLNFVMWSRPSIERKASRLCFDNTFNQVTENEEIGKVCKNRDEQKYFPLERAGLNNALKTTLLNDCLADAIFYSGANGAALRQAMRKAVCVALADGERSNADCTKPLDRGKIVLVSESLGSKVLFDSIACSDMRRSRNVEALRNALSRTTHIYMLANQLPILGLANKDGLCPNSEGKPWSTDASSDGSSNQAGLAGFLNATRQPTSKFLDDRPPILGELLIVAFTDPNDLLSYRLTELDTSAEQSVRIVNVYDSNAGTLFGLLERPDEAHIGYRVNRDVQSLLVCGNPPSAPASPCR